MEANKRSFWKFAARSIRRPATTTARSCRSVRALGAICLSCGH